MNNYYFAVNDWDMSIQYSGTWEECKEYQTYYYNLSGVTLSIWEADEYYNR